MLGLVFAAPFLLFLVIFALSNRATVQVGLWPTDLLLVVPLSLAVLGAGALFFVLGAFVASLSAARERRRARRAERRVLVLEREVETLRPRPGRPSNSIGSGTAMRTIQG